MYFIYGTNPLFPYSAFCETDFTMQHMSNSFKSLLSDQVIALEWGTVLKGVFCLCF